MSTVVWFRADLRADDNSALAAAVSSGGAVIGLFLIADGEWALHHWGPRRQLFVWRHVLELREELAARGIPLWVERAPRFADAPAAVSAFAVRHGARNVVVNIEYGADELARDERVGSSLKRHGIALQRLHDLTLLAPGGLRAATGTAYRVYTPFRRSWLQRTCGQRIRCFPSPRSAAPMAPPPLPAWQPPNATLDATWWPSGEHAARERLRKFVEQHIDAYHQDRDIPARDGTSRLSPYLAVGALSVRRCFEAALACNHGEWDSGGRGAQTWLNELIWREFYTHTLHDYPQVSRNRAFRTETEMIAWNDPANGLARWQQGTTGFPLVDAGMRQLAATGWMHNRLRMVTAMFLAKYLLIDWRHGERWFMQQLVDGDLAANNGGWQWSASTGTDAAPYFRVLSPVRQAERFDPQGTYMRRYVGELAYVSTRALLTPGHPELLAAGYPAPMLDTRVAHARMLSAFRTLGDHRRAAG